MTKPKKTKEHESKAITPFSGYWPDIERTIENFRKEMEKTFSQFPSLSIPSIPKIPQTSCDVIDEGTQFKVRMDVPGVKRDEINLNVTDNSLEVSAEHKAEAEEKKKNYLRKERSHVSYYRALPLPEKIVSEQAKAKLSDGVLEITLPKSKSTSKPQTKSIKIE